MGKHGWREGVLLVGLAAVIVGAPAPAVSSTPNIVTLQNPGGGTIAYTQLPGQQTVRSIMAKALAYAANQYGGRPQIAKVLRSSDGTGLEVVFNLAARGGQQMTGLAIAYVPGNGLAEGAVLTDISSRFLTTIKPMLAKLQSQTATAGGAAPTMNAAAGPAARNSSPGAGASTVSSPGSAGGSGSSGASAAAMPTATAPAAALHRVAFADGSGSLGLPDGWSITRAQSGDVSAKGPHGELLRFGLTVSAIDPTNPQSRQLMGRGPGGVATGNFVQIRYGVDGATAMKAVSDQLSQKEHRAAATGNFSVDQDLGGGRNYFLFGDVDMHDGQGSQATWVQVGMSAPNMVGFGAWQLTFFQVVAPKSLAAQETATVQAMFKSYQANVAAIQQQVTAAGVQRDAIFNSAMGSVQHGLDASDRQTAGMSNYLRNNTVIRDNDLNGHATVSDALGDALVQGNPNRFQVVPTSQYVKGVDY